MSTLKSILLIDDDQINNFIVLNKLKAIPEIEHIHCEENGQLAIQFIKNAIEKDPTQLPCIILLDINMPVMDGWEFLEEFEKLDHAFTERMKVYMVSSSVYTEDIEKSKQYSNITAFISKPLTKDKINEIIQERMKTA